MGNITGNGYNVNKRETQQNSKVKESWAQSQQIQIFPPPIYPLSRVIAKYLETFTPKQV